MSPRTLKYDDYSLYSSAVVIYRDRVGPRAAAGKVHLQPRATISVLIDNIASTTI